MIGMTKIDDRYDQDNNRLIQLLLVPDDDLKYQVLEFLYTFTGISNDNGMRVCGCVRFNVMVRVTIGTWF